ncbi:MAG: chemotaxis-specific protein-glutamate methyltransferase CheB [Minwuia sp.]|uniref:chemotaxis-specific protein-glutamate methyltransferase CheB n=1 Tax=Minwuia sp. TaxID=2493630 RepID=UPI003A8C07B7
MADTDGRLKVLVVDDAVVPRGMIRQWLEEDADAAVQTAANGRQALDKLKTFAADVITLDLEMPVLSGYEALPLIRQTSPNSQIVVVSGASRRAGSVTFDALRRGAADFVAKQDRENRSAFRREIVEKVKTLGSLKRKPVAAAPVADAPAPRPRRTADITLKRSVVAIGSSTGGPQALADLLAGLGGRLTVPVLISQHLPVNFSKVFAQNLSRKTGLDCVEATDGEPLISGRVYIAPGDRHMMVAQSGAGATIRLWDGPREHHCRPAVNPLFRSVAEVYGRRAMAIVLTGMGSDGAEGAETIAAAGGIVAVQDQATSIVWGMPGATFNRGVADAVLPVPDIAKLIREHCK